MVNRYNKFYSDDWEKAYSFWHKIIDRGDMHVGILRRLIEQIDKLKIKILDLGCGDGDEIKETLDSFKNKNFEVVANDTAPEALEKYQKNNLDYVIRLESRKLEDLPEKLEEKFDIILFSHSLYEIELDGLFNKYFQFLNKDGSIVVFLDSEESQIEKIRKVFWKKVNGVEFDENVAEDIIKELKKNKTPFEVEELFYGIDLKKLENINSNGLKELYIPFIFRTREINEELMEEIVEYIKNNQKEEKSKKQTLSIIIPK